MHEERIHVTLCIFNFSSGQLQVLADLGLWFLLYRKFGRGIEA
jgi:hypothetical protein